MQSIKKSLFGKSHVKLLIIALGTLIFSAGFNVFLVGNKINAGGVTAIATTLYHFFQIPVSLTNIIANAILMIIGVKTLGKKAALKNVYGIIALSASLEITSHLPTYTEDLTVSCVAGGMIMGLGIGIVIRNGASTGGSDFMALILRNRLPHLSVATILMIIDCIIIIISGFVLESITVTVYSAVALFVSAKVTDSILTLGSGGKNVQIITTAREAISKDIMNVIGRGVTAIESRGMYTGEKRTMLVCLVSSKQLPRLVSIVKRHDSSAFVIITDAREVLGTGFKAGNDYN